MSEQVAYVPLISMGSHCDSGDFNQFGEMHNYRCRRQQDSMWRILMDQDRNSREAEMLDFLVQRLVWHFNRIIEAKTTMQGFVALNEMRAVIEGSQHLNLSFDLATWFRNAVELTPGIEPVPDTEEVVEFLQDANPRNALGLKFHYPTKSCLVPSHEFGVMKERLRASRFGFVCDACSGQIHMHEVSTMMHCQECNYGICKECYGRDVNVPFNVVDWINRSRRVHRRERFGTEQTPAAMDEGERERECAIAACRIHLDQAHAKWKEWPVCRFILLGVEGSVFESDCWSYEKTFRLAEPEDLSTSMSWIGLARCFAEVIQMGRLDMDKFDRAFKNSEFSKGMTKLKEVTLPQFVQRLILLKSVLNSHAQQSKECKAKVGAASMTAVIAMGQYFSSAAAMNIPYFIANATDVW